MNNYPAVLGIYSLRREEVIGVGATATTHDQVTFWYARQLDSATAEVQPLSTSHLPSGIKKTLPVEEFLKTYTPEPRYYAQNPVQALNSLKDKVDQGPAGFAQATLAPEERAFIKALMLDGIVVEGGSDKGKAHPDRKEFERLRTVLRILVAQGDDFTVEQKTRLSHFGVSLRKGGHFLESITFFLKALELHHGDENLHFNLARVHFDKGDLPACLDTLHTAVGLNPEFDEAHKFIRYCTKKLMAAKRVEAKSPRGRQDF